MAEGNIGDSIVWLNEVDSTNEYATKYLREPKAHGLVVATNFQTDGKGQRGNVWESETGQNILISIVLKPHFLEVKRQFLLSKIVTLAICDVLESYVDNVRIKWPNDIYIKNNKVAGILIENSFSSSFIDNSIVGIGINVNQVDFSDEIPNPTSLRTETNNEYDVKQLIASFGHILNKWYEKLKNGDYSEISSSYFTRLYRKEEFHKYKANGKEFVARIHGVNDIGELVLETDGGEIRIFAFKEVFYVL